MDQATRTTVATTQSQSPLSSFLSSLMEDRFGSTQVNSKIVADNPLSHGPFFSSASTVGSTTDKLRRDLVSIARSASMCSSSSSSSRWNPNIFPSSNSTDSSACGDGSHGGHRENRSPHASQPSSSWPSSDALAVPVRRPSPEQWYRKQTEVATKKSNNRDIATTDATSSSPRIKSTLGGGSKTASDTSSALPTCPIRKLSLIPCDLLLLQAVPNFMQVSMHIEVPKQLRTLPLCKIKEDDDLVQASKTLQPFSCVSASKQKTEISSYRENEGKTIKKSSSPQPSRSPSLPPSSLSVPRSSGMRTNGNISLLPSLSPKKNEKGNSTQITALSLSSSLVAVAGSEVTTIAARTPSPSTIPFPTPPKIKKKVGRNKAILQLAGIPNSFRFPIISDNERDDDTGSSRESVTVNSCYRPGLTLTYRPRRSALKPLLPSNGGLDGYAMSSSRSTMMIPEGDTMISGSVSPPSPVEAPPLPRAGSSKQAGGTGAEPGIITRNNLQLAFQKKATSRSSMLASRRSLSETLLSCDRDTIDPCSPALSSESTLTSKQRNRDHNKRAPPVQPVRQLSRVLF
jgi:hypothetical protein